VERGWFTAYSTGKNGRDGENVGGMRREWGRDDRLDVHDLTVCESGSVSEFLEFSLDGLRSSTFRTGFSRKT
jgi:hypothetical protein